MIKFVSEPAIANKIQKMKQRVRWQDPAIKERQIDQTRMVIEDGQADNPEFSFLVVGDSGSGYHHRHNPQRQVAEQMLPHHQECRFMLHTGDVVYLVGSSEYYYQNFISPYREFLVGGDKPKSIAYDKMTFQLPILPIPGNHDYYDLPLFFGLASLTTLPVRRLLRSKLDFDIGWHGSGQGDAYARAFLDYLRSFKLPGQLERHLDEHYITKTDTGRCLAYQPGQFTRLPNRYYTFRYGGIDFFALDSNTFNNPLPLPTTREGDNYRKELEQRRDRLEQEKLEIIEQLTKLNLDNSQEAEKIDDLQGNLSQIEEIIVDIEKQLTADQTTVTDIEQLDWLKARLIESWNNKEIRGRVIYFHHPPYVTEATKWQQAQTLAVRQRLRDVFDEVAKAVGSFAQNTLTEERPIVDLVLNGHAHCLEHIKTVNTGHADSYINWIVCGGSGFSLRRQRVEGTDLMESFGDEGERLVSQSQLFVGRNGTGSHKRRPYSCLRIDVKGGQHPKFVIRPIVTERYQGKWSNYEIKPFII
jgi:Calcineurin-like phosphoesterase